MPDFSFEDEFEFLTAHKAIYIVTRNVIQTVTRLRELHLVLTALLDLTEDLGELSASDRAVYRAGVATAKAMWSSSADLWVELVSLADLCAERVWN